MAFASILDKLALGSHVRIYLHADPELSSSSSPSISQSFEGVVFSVHITTTGSSTIVLRKTKHHTWQKADYFIISMDSISNVEVLGVGEPLPELREFDAETNQKRFNSSAKREEERIARRGKGVGEVGQNIFDRLARNFPGLFWSDKTIVIADRIELREPYTQSAICFCDNVNEKEKEVLGRIALRLKEALGNVRISLNLSL